MKILLTYIIFSPIILLFLIYKAIEGIINGIHLLVDSEEKLFYQLNVFNLERLIIKSIQNGFRKMGLPIW
jgi:hypothetical protein